jgi:hypothetical protein
MALLEAIGTADTPFDPANLPQLGARPSAAGRYRRRETRRAVRREVRRATLRDPNI